MISEEVYEKLSAEVDSELEGDNGPFWFVPQASLPQRLKEGITGAAEVEEISIETGAICDGRNIGELSWPQNFVIASLRRGAQIIIPKGDTTLYSGDMLTVVGDVDSILEAKKESSIYQNWFKIFNNISANKLSCNTINRLNIGVFFTIVEKCKK